MRSGRLRGIGTVAVVATGFLVLAACDTTTEPNGTAFFSANLTGGDETATASYVVAAEENGEEGCVVDGVAAAEVDISSIYFQGVPGGEGGRADIYDAENDEDGPLSVDLCALAEGQDIEVTEEPVEVAAGQYGQLRLVTVEGRVWLEGEEDEEPLNLQLPSGAQTGIKVLPAHAEEGEDAEVELFTEDGDSVTLDVAVVDIEDNFVFQGAGETPDSILFSPVLQMAD